MIERIASILVGLALVTGTALTLWGLGHTSWAGANPRYVRFLIYCAVLVATGARWNRRSPLVIGTVLAAGIALLAGALWPLLVTLWFAVASALLGRAVLIGLRIKVDSDNWLTSFLIGAGVYGTAVGLLAHYPANYPGVYGTALAIPVILNWRVIVEKCCSHLVRAVEKNYDGLLGSWLDVSIAAVALVYFVVALMPEVGFDALAMHLFVPAHLALRHQWGFDATTYVWAVMPMLGDWVFAIGYMLAGETAARLINVGFIFLLGWLVRELVIWAGGSLFGARWAILIFLSTPLTFTEGSSLFIESVWASFVVAGTLAVLRSCSTLGIPKFDLLLAGVLLGCALATKAVTLTILPVLFLLLAWHYRSWYKAVGLPSLLIGVGLFTMIGSIPYVTAWWLTSNPVFPFFNKVFQSSYYPAVNFDSAATFGKGLTWDVLYRATFESGNYLEAKAGASGFQWLLLFIPSAIALVAARQRRGIALLMVGTLIVALVFQSVSYFRYAFPAWAILAAAMGLAISAASERQDFIWKWMRGASMATVGLNLIFLNAAAFYGHFAFKAIVSDSNREKYIQQRLPIRNAVELVNHLNTGRIPVAVFSHPRTAGLSADALYPSWYNHVFQGEVAAIKTEQDVANILLKRGVDFVILDSNWDGVGRVRGPETRALIEKVTEKLAEFGSISVLKIKSDYLFKTELLINPDFTSSNGWTLSGEAKYDATTGIILAGAASPAFQKVVVSPGRRYLNSVVARCAKEAALGRVQVNWSDARGKFISTDIKTFECSPNWTEHTQEVTAPLNAVNAVVYVTGHSPIPLEFKGNSLRQ